MEKLNNTNDCWTHYANQRCVKEQLRCGKLWRIFLNSKQWNLRQWKNLYFIHIHFYVIHYYYNNKTSHTHSHTYTHIYKNEIQKREKISCLFFLSNNKNSTQYSSMCVHLKAFRIPMWRAWLKCVTEGNCLCMC